MFLLFSGRHFGAHPDGHQHGVSIQISIYLSKNFLRISCLRKNAVTWILESLRVFTFSLFPDSGLYLFWMTWHQGPITRSLQLPLIPVTAFSQTDLFLVWIYFEFRSPQEPHWPIVITSTDQCWHVDMILTCSPEAALFYPHRSVLM